MTAVRRLTANPDRSLAEIVWEQRAQIAGLLATVAGLEERVARQEAALRVMAPPPSLPGAGAEATAPKAKPPRRAVVSLVMLGGKVRQIVEAVAAQHGVKPQDILGPDRTHYVAMARQEVMYHARLAGLSLAQIGRALGRDHSTVLAGIAAHKRRAGIE